MPNGQYHGRIKTGIKITNPLTLPVSVRINSPTGALRTGNGKDTWRTIRPGDTIYIPTKGRAEVDIDVHIIRYDQAGNSKKIGDGGWVPIPTIATKSKTPVKAGRAPEHLTEKKPRKEPEEEPPLRSLGELIEEMKKREEVPV